MTSSKSTFLTVRLTPVEHKAFSIKAEAFGGTSFVLREVVAAFLTDRLIIKPNPERPSLYQTDYKQVTPSSQLTFNFPE
jgi:hypothetical protein